MCVSADEPIFAADAIKQASGCRLVSAVTHQLLRYRAFSVFVSRTRGCERVATGNADIHGQVQTRRWHSDSTEDPVRLPEALSSRACHSSSLYSVVSFELPPSSKNAQFLVCGARAGIFQRMQ